MNHSLIQLRSITSWTGLSAIIFLFFQITFTSDVYGQKLDVDGDAAIKGSTTVGIPGEGNNLLLFNSERSWSFRQGGTGSSTFLELVSIGGGGNKSFFINTLGSFGITNMDSTTISTENMVRRPDGTLAVRSYKIGDLAHGGIVFWVDETGEHGLVCAIDDQSVSVQWGTLGSFTGANRDNIYSGMMNTERIIINQGTNSFAAGSCAKYAGGVYGDWYLPSKEELNLMWKNLHRFGCPNVAPDSTPCPTALGDFAADHYWSSKENGGNTNTASAQFFETGDQTDDSLKNNTSRTRAIRAF